MFKISDLFRRNPNSDGSTIHQLKKTPGDTWIEDCPVLLNKWEDIAAVSRIGKVIEGVAGTSMASTPLNLSPGWSLGADGELICNYPDDKAGWAYTSDDFETEWSVDHPDDATDIRPCTWGQWKIEQAEYDNDRASETDDMMTLEETVAAMEAEEIERQARIAALPDPVKLDTAKTPCDFVFLPVELRDFFGSAVGWEYKVIVDEDGTVRLSFTRAAAGILSIVILDSDPYWCIYDDENFRGSEMLRLIGDGRKPGSWTDFVNDLTLARLAAAPTA